LSWGEWLKRKGYSSATSWWNYGKNQASEWSNWAWKKANEVKDKVLSGASKGASKLGDFAIRGANGALETQEEMAKVPDALLDEVKKFGPRTSLLNFIKYIKPNTSDGSPKSFEQIADEVKKEAELRGIDISTWSNSQREELAQAIQAKLHSAAEGLESPFTLAEGPQSPFALLENYIQFGIKSNTADGSPKSYEQLALEVKKEAERNGIDVSTLSHSQREALAQAIQAKLDSAAEGPESPYALLEEYISNMELNKEDGSPKSYKQLASEVKKEAERNGIDVSTWSHSQREELAKLIQDKFNSHNSGDIGRVDLEQRKEDLLKKLKQKGLDEEEASKLYRELRKVQSQINEHKGSKDLHVGEGSSGFFGSLKNRFVSRVGSGPKDTFQRWFNKYPAEMRDSEKVRDFMNDLVTKNQKRIGAVRSKLTKICSDRPEVYGNLLVSYINDAVSQGFDGKGTLSAQTLKQIAGYCPTALKDPAGIGTFNFLKYDYMPLLNKIASDNAKSKYGKFLIGKLRAKASSLNILRTLRKHVSRLADKLKGIVQDGAWDNNIELPVVFKTLDEVAHVLSSVDVLKQKRKDSWLIGDDINFIRSSQKVLLQKAAQAIDHDYLDRTN